MKHPSAYLVDYGQETFWIIVISDSVEEAIEKFKKEYPKLKIREVTVSPYSIIS